MSFYLAAEWPGWPGKGAGLGAEEVPLEVILFLKVILPRD